MDGSLYYVHLIYNIYNIINEDSSTPILQIKRIVFRSKIISSIEVKEKGKLR